VADQVRVSRDFLSRPWMTLCQPITSTLKIAVSYPLQRGATAPKMIGKRFWGDKDEVDRKK
jgi:hypothetical protein